jgi:hypothetical protein
MPPAHRSPQRQAYIRSPDRPEAATTGQSSAPTPWPPSDCSSSSSPYDALGSRRRSWLRRRARTASRTDRRPPFPATTARALPSLGSDPERGGARACHASNLSADLRRRCPGAGGRRRGRRDTGLPRPESRPTPVACQFFRADESPFILFPTTLRGVGSDLQPAARNAPAQRTGGDRGPPVSGGSQGVGGPGKPTGPESGAAVVPSCPAGASGPPRR